MTAPSRRVLLFLPLLLLFTALVPAPPDARAGGPRRLTILFDTHFHGNLTGAMEVSIAHYAGLVQQRRAALGVETTLWVGAGDDLGSSTSSAIFRGRHMIDAFNAAGLDANTMGNHEFDYGPDNALEQIGASRFPWLSANVVDRRTGEVFGAAAGARRYLIREVAGVRVGLTGAAWQFLSATQAGPNVEVLDAATALATVVPEMRAAGAQVVVVMSHLCLAEARAVATAVRGIDAIVGDHCAERDPAPEVVNGTVIARRGDEFDALGELTLDVEGGRVVGHTYQHHAVTAESPQDPAVAALVADYRSQLSAELMRAIGMSTVALDARRATVRAEESNLGNLIADVLRAWGSADVALQNGGGIRGDRLYEPGVLTRGTVIENLPFNNTAVLLRVSGATIRAALENGVSRLMGDGRFPQVSGLRFRYDPEAPPGMRVLAVTIGDEPLDPARSYTLATNDFLANGGDDYTMLTEAEVLVDPQSSPVLAELVIEAIERVGTIAPQVEGRIVAGRE